MALEMLAPARAARLLLLAARRVQLRGAAFNPDQERDEQGRWTSGASFSSDVRQRYPNAPDTKAYSDQETQRVVSDLKRAGKLNKDGTISLYHATLSEPKDIEERGLIPSFEPAPGQDWKAEHSDYATYFHLDKDVAERDIEFGGSVIEARIPITSKTLSRFLPDEDASSDPEDGVRFLIHGGGAVAFIGGVPASAVKTVSARKFEGAAAKETPLHAAADRHVPKLSVAFRYAFAMGRKALRRNPKNVDAAVRAVKAALEDVLPATLLKVVAAGGEAGAAMLGKKKIRAASHAAFDLSELPHDVAIWVSDALDRCSFDFSKLLGGLKAVGRDTILVLSKDLNHGDRSEPGFRSGGFTYALANYDGSIVLDRRLDERETTQMVLHEAAHMVDFFYMTDEMRSRILDAYVLENSLAERPPWFVEPEPEGLGYYGQAGESFMAGFVRAFSDVLVSDEEFAARATPLVVDAIRMVLGDYRATFDALDRRAAAAKIKFKFSSAHPAAVRWAREHAAKLVTQVTDTTRERIRVAIKARLETGEDAVDEILAAVGDEDRAELIARHETMAAASEGQRQAWGQAVEKGLLAEDARRTWITVGDDRVCLICEPLDGKYAALDGEYPGEGGDGPPAHVACRCTEGIA